MIWVVVLVEELLLFSEIDGDFLINAIELISFGVSLLGNKNCVLVFDFYDSFCCLFDEKFAILCNAFSYNWIRLINNRLFIPLLNKLGVFEKITEWVFVIHKTDLFVEGPTNWIFNVLDFAKLKTMHKIFFFEKYIALGD